MAKKCYVEISDEFAKDLRRRIKKKHAHPRKKYMTIEEREEYNKTIKRLEKSLKKVCDKFN